jgi:hypothetical protein
MRPLLVSLIGPGDDSGARGRFGAMIRSGVPPLLAAPVPAVTVLARTGTPDLAGTGTPELAAR